MIVAWDNLTFRDWCWDGTSHAYTEHPEGGSCLSRACSPPLVLSELNLREGGRLQRHVPELPICSDCASIAGLPIIRHGGAS